ncbi:MAG TPA: hypothetical protein VFB79_01850, partial [Candidatus Angelobacter sp.]|nr:hypothetical protein [Candidatus Angelobacter sp.]
GRTTARAGRRDRRPVQLYPIYDAYEHEKVTLLWFTQQQLRLAVMFRDVGVRVIGVELNHRLSALIRGKAFASITRSPV